MSNLTSFEGAAAAVNDPTTAVADLAAIVRDYPRLRTAVVAHPNVDMELLDWLGQNGDEDVKRAVAQRLASQTMGPTGLGETIAGLPLWRSDESLPPVAADTESGMSQYLPDFLPYAPDTGTMTQASAEYAPYTGGMTPTSAEFAPYTGGMTPTSAEYAPYTGSMTPTGTAYAAQPPKPRPDRVKTGLVIAVIALVLALIGAGVLVGIPGTGFSGVLKPGGAAPQTQMPAAPSSNQWTMPPAGMPDCSTVSWQYGGTYPEPVTYGQWNDAAGGPNSLLICQGPSGYGIVRGGAWANDTLTFFEVVEIASAVYQTTFTGGDLNGITVLLSPNGAYQVTGGSTSHLGVTQGWQLLVEAYFPQNGVPFDTATQQVLSLQSLVWQNAYVRPSLSSYIQVCDSSGIQTVLTLRQDFLAALQVSLVDQIPNGNQLLATLQNAIQYSIQSDQSYLDWAQKGCQKPVPVLQSDTDAGNAKDQFAAMWNSQIAGRYPGAEQVSSSQL